MKGRSLLVHRLKTGPVQVYEVESIELGATHEIGVVRVRSLTEKNSQNGDPVQCAIPSNLAYAMVDAGIVEAYDRIEGQNKP